MSAGPGVISGSAAFYCRHASLTPSRTAHSLLLTDPDARVPRYSSRHLKPSTTLAPIVINLGDADVAVASLRCASITAACSRSLNFHAQSFLKVWGLAVTAHERKWRFNPALHGGSQHLVSGLCNYRNPIGLAPEVSLRTGPIFLVAFNACLPHNVLKVL